MWNVRYIRHISTISYVFFLFAHNEHFLNIPCYIRSIQYISIMVWCCRDAIYKIFSDKILFIHVIGTDKNAMQELDRNCSDFPRNCSLFSNMSIEIGMSFNTTLNKELM